MAFDLALEYETKAVFAVLGLRWDEKRSSGDVATEVRKGLDRARTRVLDGFPVSVLERLAKLGLTMTGVSLACGIAPRTIRRRQAGNETLDANESDRVLRLASAIVAIAEHEGSPEAAVRWLTTPHEELGGVAPIAHFDTEPGRVRVELLHEDDVKLRELRALQARRKRDALVRGKGP